MSEGLIVPGWYRIASRGLATATIVGLVGCMLNDTYHVRMSFLVGLVFGMLGVYGGPLFVLWRWVGVSLGYVSESDGKIYAVVLVATGCAVVVLALLAH